MPLAVELAGVSFGYRPGQSVLEGVSLGIEAALFVATTLPVWVVAARLYGLYDRDEEHADNTTTDDLAGVFQLTTLGAWLFVTVSWATRLADPELVARFAVWRD